MNKLHSILFVLLQLAVAGTAQADAEALLREVADTYLEHHLRVHPLTAYAGDLPLDRHHRFTENRPAELRQFEALQDASLMALSAIDPEALTSPSSRVFQYKLAEWLAAERGVRVCRSELWAVDHIYGTHARLQQLVKFQPLATAAERRDALLRWSAAARYYDREVENLRRGLADGYSAPRSVVRRLIGQLARLAAYAPGEHPYYALAQKTEDPRFRQAFAALLRDELMPAMARYAAFLEKEYLPAAREELAITALPKGRECYMSRYRRYTTLARTPEQVHAIGMAAVEDNVRTVTELGKTLYGARDFTAAVAAARDDPRVRIPSREAYHLFLEELLERSRRLSTDAFAKMPGMPLEVVPLPPFRQGSGVSAHYLPGSAERPGQFVYDPATYEQSSFSSAEILAVHEGYPGHHLQIALGLAGESFHPLEKLLSNAAYIEGWARYAEGLAEELGIYRHDATRIQRRAWPARGMVLDTGLHILGWNREQLVDFLKASGRPNYAADPDQILDRMAIWPAQLTAYDSGALEIMSLREDMRAAQGDAFDLRAFHSLVLANGEVPMGLLREQVERVIQASQSEQ